MLRAGELDGDLMKVVVIKGAEGAIVVGMDVGADGLPQLPWSHRILAERGENGTSLVVDGWLCTLPLSMEEEALLEQGEHEVVLACLDDGVLVSTRMAVLLVS